MTLHVFGGMNEKSQDGRGKFSPAYRSRLGENAFIDGLNLLYRHVHLTFKSRDQFPAGRSGGSFLSFTSQCRELGCVEGFPSGICKKAIQNSRKVLKVKSH